MATFLEKNKKKSALAALLLFIRTRKTAIALLLLVALASFWFVGPSNLLLSLPGGARLAAAAAWVAGKVGLGGGKRDYGDLLAAFKAAKANGGKAGWASFAQGGGAAGVGSGSVDFVKGSAADLAASSASGENLPKPGSVDGVLNPDDAKNRGEGEGVALSEGDVTGERAGLVKSAFAGGFGSGAGGSMSGGAFASGGFFGGGSSASSGKLSDLVKGGLEGIKPATGNGTAIAAGVKSKLSAAKASQINTRTAKGLVGTRTITGQRAFVQLATGRGRAAISVAPNCTAGGGCPGEFASTNTGAVYDGNTLTGDHTTILTAPIIDGISSPNLPESGIADSYVHDAEQMAADAEKCKELDKQYGPTELAYDKQQQALSNVFDALNCGQGSCSRWKADICQELGDAMKNVCRASMTVRCQHMHECPLTKDNHCSPSECDGPARTRRKITDFINGRRTTTMDMGETEGGCPEALDNLPSIRQAVQNSINSYRGANCPAIRNDNSYVGSLSYYYNCSGRENMVIQTCRQYAITLCKGDFACGDTHSCTVSSSGAAEECKIDELNGIEEFIQKEATY